MFDFFWNIKIYIPQSGFWLFGFSLIVSGIFKSNFIHYLFYKSCSSNKFILQTFVSKQIFLKFEKINKKIQFQIWNSSTTTTTKKRCLLNDENASRFFLKILHKPVRQAQKNFWISSRRRRRKMSKKYTRQIWMMRLQRIAANANGLNKCTIGLSPNSIHLTKKLLVENF